MNLFTMLDEKTVLPNLKAENKEQVINDLIDTLRYDIDSDTIEEIRNSVFEREKLCLLVLVSLAIPHCKTKAVIETMLHLHA